MAVLRVGAGADGDGRASCVECAVAGGEDEVGVAVAAADAEFVR